MTQWPATPPVERIGDLVRRQTESDSGRAALIDGDRRLTYGEVDDLVERCAGALVAAGVEHGAKVAMVTTPRWEQVVTLLACARLGAVFVGLNPRHREDELAYVVADSEPALLIAQRAFEGRDLEPAFKSIAESHPAAAPRVALDGELAGAESFEGFLDAGRSHKTGRIEQACAATVPTDPVAVVYTSGSTGERKGVLLTHQSLLWTFWQANRELALSPPISCLNDLPVDHLGGLVERLLPALLTAGTVVLHPRFDPHAFLRDAARHRVSYLQAEVTQWLRCVDLDEFDKADLHAVQVALYTGAAAPRGLLERLAARFPRVATGYGMTETSGPITLTDRVTPDAPTGIVGKPVHGVELRVRDDDGAVSVGEEGTIQVRGLPVTPGYLGRPAATRRVIDRDGWLDTGDRGLVADDGMLRLIGRNSDMYKSGGYNIYPREIEGVIEAHPGVAHAAVVSVPDPMFQEVGVAFVAPAAGAGVDGASLEAFCREHLANYKVPKSFFVLPELPLLENGKVDRRGLRERHSQGTVVVGPAGEHDAGR